MITIKQRGDFSKLTSYLERIKEVVHKSDLDRFGKAGVEALSTATPFDTGNTASCWYYQIEHSRGSFTIPFHNSHIQ